MGGGPLIRTHAGGVAVRVRDGRPEFLLVRSSDGRRRVLPKGHIEPGEDVAAAARREMEEEAGFSLEPGPSLGVFRYERAGESVVTEYFLMPASDDARGVGSGEPGRDPQWFTLARARADACVPAGVLDVLEEAAGAR